MRGPLLTVSLLLATPAFAADAGTVEPPTTRVLVDTATGESWSTVTATVPGSFILTGPAKFQVGFRVNVPADAAVGTPGIVSIRTGGKPIAQFRLQPKAGTDTWKDEATFKPSPAVGFFVEVAAGPQAYEFRLNGGGDFGGAVRVIESSQSKRPLPATAPVVKVPAPATAVAVASPAPTGVPAKTPKPVATPARVVVAGAPLWHVSIGGGPTLEAEGEEDATLAWSAIADVRWHPRKFVFVAAGGEWRAGTQRVPVPGSPGDGAYENRQSADASAGLRLDVGQLEILAGPWTRFAEHDSELAPRRFLLGGGRLRLGMRFGAAEAHIGGEAGAPLMDETPPNYQSGDLVSGGGWNVGGSMRLRGNLRLGLEYRGEVLGRFASERVANGFVSSAVMEF